MEVTGKTEKREKRTNSSLGGKLYEKCVALAEYALEKGIEVPASAMKILVKKKDELNENEKEEIIQIHKQLSKKVLPATPEGIYLLAKEEGRNRFLKTLGPVPLVRWMMFWALISLIAFIILAALGIGLYRNIALTSEANWCINILYLLYLLTAAALGSSFLTLFKTNRFIVERNFDAKYASAHWIRFVLGLIAGIILALLIPVGSSSTVQSLAKPTLAMIGGFAADVVYRILIRMTEAIESLVRGSIRERLASMELETRARLAQQELQARAKMASELRAIQGITDMDKIKAEIEKLQEDIIKGLANEK